MILQGYLSYRSLRLLTHPDKRSCFQLLTSLQTYDLSVPNGHLWLDESFNKQKNIYYGKRKCMVVFIPISISKIALGKK